MLVICLKANRTCHSQARTKGGEGSTIENEKRCSRSPLGIRDRREMGRGCGSTISDSFRPFVWLNFDHRYSMPTLFSAFPLGCVRHHLGGLVCVTFVPLALIPPNQAAVYLSHNRVPNFWTIYLYLPESSHREETSNKGVSSRRSISNGNKVSADTIQQRFVCRGVCTLRNSIWLNADEKVHLFWHSFSRFVSTKLSTSSLPNFTDTFFLSKKENLRKFVKFNFGIRWMTFISNWILTKYVNCRHAKGSLRNSLLNVIRFLLKSDVN